MRVISLNTWGGRVGKDNLIAFLKKYENTDVFCLQEVWSAAYREYEGRLAGGRELRFTEVLERGLQIIQDTLPNHVPFFRPHFLDSYGLLMMVHEKLEVIMEGEVWVYKQKGHMPEDDVGRHARNIQYLTLTDPAVTVINFHGLWAGSGVGKIDTEERLEQSDKILTFTSELKNPFVLVGDFNLLPDTESLKKFEHAGLRNLIKEFGVTSTRTNYYTKSEKFADYAFISPDVELKAFRVLPDEVSDHSPLLIEI